MFGGGCCCGRGEGWGRGVGGDGLVFGERWKGRRVVNVYEVRWYGEEFGVLSGMIFLG